MTEPSPRRTYAISRSFISIDAIYRRYLPTLSADPICRRKHGTKSAQRFLRPVCLTKCTSVAIPHLSANGLAREETNSLRLRDPTEGPQFR